MKFVKTIMLIMLMALPCWGVRELRYNSNNQQIIVGPFLDKTDGITPEETITLAAMDEAAIAKAGSTNGIDITGSGIMSTQMFMENGTTQFEGYYIITLSALYTDTLGPLRIVFQDDDVFLPFFEDFMVVNRNYYDSKYGSDTLEVDVTLWKGLTTSLDNVISFWLDTSTSLANIEAMFGDSATKSVTTYYSDPIQTAALKTAVKETFDEAPLGASVNNSINDRLSAIETWKETLDTASKMKIYIYDEDSPGLTENDGIPVELSQSDINDIVSAIDVNGIGTLLDTTVSSPTANNTASTFTITAGWAADKAYSNGTLIVVTDLGASTLPIARRIKNYTSGRVVTLDEPLPFIPNTGDEVTIYADMSVKKEKGV